MLVIAAKLRQPTIMRAAMARFVKDLVPRFVTYLALMNSIGGTRELHLGRHQVGMPGHTGRANEGWL